MNKLSRSTQDPQRLSIILDMTATPNEKLAFVNNVCALLIESRFGPSVWPACAPARPMRSKGGNAGRGECALSPDVWNAAPVPAVELPHARFAKAGIAGRTRLLLAAVSVRSLSFEASLTRKGTFATARVSASSPATRARPPTISPPSTGLGRAPMRIA